MELITKVDNSTHIYTDMQCIYTYMRRIASKQSRLSQHNDHIATLTHSVGDETSDTKS